jgi:hypothetical protein
MLNIYMYIYIYIFIYVYILQSSPSTSPVGFYHASYCDPQGNGDMGLNPGTLFTKLFLFVTGVIS